MKQTRNFNISVPELGDRPDITQVSNAIENLEDALAGTAEVFSGVINGALLTLTSPTRTTKRTRYYEGMTAVFVANAQINPNQITKVKVDSLGEQVASFPFLISNGETVVLIYKSNQFIASRFNVAKSNSVSSTSTDIVATSQAVKTAYDKGAEGLKSATSANSNANSRLLKSGDTMTGPLTMPNDKYYASNNAFAINLRNSDMIGVNGIYFEDLSDGIGEGFMFPKKENPTNSANDYFQFVVKPDGNPYVDNNVVYNAKSHKFLPVIGNHTYYWTGATSAQGKKCMGGIHFDTQDNAKQYLSFASTSSQTLDMIIDGEFFCNDGNSRVFNQSFTPKMDTMRLYSGWFVPNSGSWTSTSVNISNYDYVSVTFSLNGQSWAIEDTRTITLSASALKKGCEFFLSLTQGGSGSTSFEAMKVRAVNGILQFANYGSGYMITNNGILQIWGDKLI